MMFSVWFLLPAGAQSSHILKWKWQPPLIPFREFKHVFPGEPIRKHPEIHHNGEEKALYVISSVKPCRSEAVEDGFTNHRSGSRPQENHITHLKSLFVVSMVAQSGVVHL